MGEIIVRDCAANDTKKIKPIKIPKLLFSLSMRAQDLDLTNSEAEVQIRNMESVTMMAKPLTFENKDHIRFLTKEGIELLYNFRKKKIVCYAKRDNWATIRNGSQNSAHHILDEANLKKKDTLARLIRRCNQYKVMIEFSKYYYAMDHKRFTPNYMKRQMNKPDLLSYVYKVDHSNSKQFKAEISFTLLNWKSCEQIMNNPHYSFDDIDRY